MDDVEKKNILDFIRNLIGSNLINSAQDCEGVDVAIIDRNSLVDVAKSFRDNPDLRMRHLSFVTAIDRIDMEKLLYAVYEFFSLDDDRRIRIKVPVAAKDPWVPSITSIFPSANWHEREMMECFGIEVRGHPDPRKLLLPDWVTEKPLRKSFPSGGDELWAFHEKTIEMFNEKGDYAGSIDDDWLERFNE